MPYITKKFTRPGETIIIIPLTAVIIVADAGGAVAVVKGMVEGVEAEAMDAEILRTLQAS